MHMDPVAASITDNDIAYDKSIDAKNLHEEPKLPRGYTFPSILPSITPDQYSTHRHAKDFGTSNPTLMDNQFWKYMILAHFRESKYTAYDARKAFQTSEEDVYADLDPVWCFERYGQSRTELPDGRVIYVGGEHEDFYDPDFCIYNDVVVIAAPEQGANPQPLTPECIQIYGYPLSTFPPTDHHTATFLPPIPNHPTRGQESILIIGCLGYTSSQSRQQTEVYQLRLDNYEIQRVETVGTGPVGGTSGHRAKLKGEGEEAVVWISRKDGEFRLRVSDMRWL